MDLILIMVSGLVGAGLVLKKNLLPVWIFLVNLCFATYVAIFLTPLLIPLLDISGLAEGYKSAISFGLLFLIADILLSRIPDQFLPNNDVELPLPSWSVLIKVLSGFLSGILLAGIVIFLFVQMPFFAAGSSSQAFRSTSSSVLVETVHILNFFSCQTLSPEGEKALQKLNLLPGKNNDNNSNANNAKDSSKAAEPAAETTNKKEESPDNKESSDNNKEESSEDNNKEESKGNSASEKENELPPEIEW